jgi:hypothetical protein
MLKSVIGFVVVAAMLVVGAPRARADAADPHSVFPFSGSGRSGTIAPDITWLTIGTNIHQWTTGFAHWPSSLGGIDDFTMTFTRLPAGVTIGSGAFNSMFFTPGGVIPWHSAISNHDRTGTITFTAPNMAGELSHGDLFAITINLSNSHGLPVNGVRFSGSWSAVPEPSSLLLFGSGLLLIGTLGRKLLHA